VWNLEIGGSARLAGLRIRIEPGREREVSARALDDGGKRSTRRDEGETHTEGSTRIAGEEDFMQAEGGGTSFSKESSS